jgi:hypothetical protein
MMKAKRPMIIPPSDRVSTELSDIIWAPSLWDLSSLQLLGSSVSAFGLSLNKLRAPELIVKVLRKF